MEKHAGVVLRAANKVFVDDSFHVRDEFSKSLEKHVDATADICNFRQDPDGETQRINQWVEEKTNHKIRNLLAGGEITADTVLVLISALYFKAPWHAKFDPYVRDSRFRDDANPTFLGLSGADQRVLQDGIKFMELRKIRNGDFPLNFFKGEASGIPITVVEIPYAGYRQSMVIFMPDVPEDLPKVESEWKKNPDFLDDLVEKMDKNEEFVMDKEIILHLPNFKVGGETIDIQQALKGVGLGSIFSDAADLSKISLEKVKVDAAVHQAVVDVDENGTEAAAATAFGISRMALPFKSGVLQIDITQAFLFQIRCREIFTWNKEDMKSRHADVVLFVGRIGDVKSIQPIREEKQ